MGTSGDYCPVTPGNARGVRAGREFGARPSRVTTIALIGWGLAHFLYSARPGTADRWAEKFSGVYTTLLNKYYVDELYDLLFVEPLKRWGVLLDWFDRTVVDGIVRGVGHLANWVPLDQPGSRSTSSTAG